MTKGEAHDPVPLTTIPTFTRIAYSKISPFPSLQKRRDKIAIRDGRAPQEAAAILRRLPG